MITSKELAKIAGVSPSTVSRVMNDSPRISEERKAQIRKLAIEHGFMLNSQAQSLKTKKTGTIAILMPKYFSDLCTNIFFTYLYDIISNELDRYDYDIMVIYSQNKTKISPLVRMIQIQKADGYLILRPNLTKNEVKTLDQYNIPYAAIFMQNILQPLKNTFFINTEQGGYLAGQYFGRKKFDTLIFLGLEGNSVDNGPRLKGFTRGIAETNNKQNISIFSGKMSIDGGYKAIKENAHLISNNSGIYAYNDMMALGAINALTEIGFKIPSEVEILGTDDVPLATAFRPALSTIHAPIHDLAKEACKTLINTIENGWTSSVVKEYTPSLVLRDTTKNI